MTSQPKRRWQGWLTAFLAVAVVGAFLYVLGIGPAYWLFDEGFVPVELFDPLYGWLDQEMQMGHLGGAAASYYRWWGR